ncbi:unnamed protein product [Danaus chrysippus]|uniref:(African queen) hypothetical protein n=1 Tax=Danaus chrysippus TaxID=151541 RepID=A0A8J2W5J4_9NEOP|nr:unnamed protein product [Danaus chrysippus]
MVFGQYQYTIKKSLRGNPIISIDGYRFSRRYVNQNKAKVRWRCSTHHSLKCRAVVFTVKGEVVYTYSLHSLKMDSSCLRRRWRCSTHTSKGCLGKLTTLNDKIIKINAVHNHQPVMN